MLTGAWASNEHAPQKYNCSGGGEAVAYSMQMIGVNHIQPCPRLQKYNPNAVSAKVQSRKVPRSKRVPATLGAFMMDAALEQKYNFVSR
jgi:hypothetical protein